MSSVTERLSLAAVVLLGISACFLIARWFAIQSIQQRPRYSQRKKVDPLIVVFLIFSVVFPPVWPLMPLVVLLHAVDTARRERVPVLLMAPTGLLLYQILARHLAAWALLTRQPWYLSLASAFFAMIAALALATLQLIDGLSYRGSGYGYPVTIDALTQLLATATSAVALIAKSVNRPERAGSSDTQPSDPDLSRKCKFFCAGAPSALHAQCVQKCEHGVDVRKVTPYRWRALLNGSTTTN